jgi:hypothetical protein
MTILNSNIRKKSKLNQFHTNHSNSYCQLKILIEEEIQKLFSHHSRKPFIAMFKELKILFLFYDQKNRARKEIY